MDTVRFVFFLAVRALLPLVIAVALVPNILPIQAQEGRTSARLPVDGRLVRMGYYVPYDATSLTSLRSNVLRLDVVAPHWITVDAEGQVKSEEKAEAAAFLRTTSATVLLSVALDHRSSGHPILMDPQVSARAIRELVAVARLWDGIALDFEGLEATDRVALSRFINQLGTALHEAGKYYAVAIPAKTSDLRTGWAGAFDYAAIAAAADLYLVMTYGFTTSSSSEPGSTAPLPWVDRAVAYLTSQIPPDRVLLGVASYGFDWNVAQGPPARALRYSDTAQILERTGATPVVDPESQSATFRYESAGEAHEVWFEDHRALAAKLALVRKYGLRGAGAWRLGQESPRAWEVWDELLGPPSMAEQPSASAD